jgi:hypothetical protein
VIFCLKAFFLMCMLKYKFDAHEPVSDFSLLTDVKEGTYYTQENIQISLSRR